MCDQQRLRPACAYAQYDLSICKSLEYSMNVQLLAEQHLEFLSLKGAAQADLSLHLSKGHIVRNHMSRLICLEQDVGYACSGETAELHCKLPCCEIITRMKLTYYEHQQKPQTLAPPPHPPHKKQNKTKTKKQKQKNKKKQK